MRLHRVRLVAVGPFAEEQVIDFDRLSAGGLFLFEGPTGVGKSTVLDAVVFGLYGGVASQAGDVARMRSDFADPGIRSVVEVEFSVRGRRLRITRSPEHVRPKLRGSGTTVEKASVLLERHDSEGWVTLTHAKDEAGALLGELIGLTREQFRQVVLLPQGEFATFLRSDDDTRRDLLATLFGTQFYERVTEALRERAASAREERRTLLERFSTREAAAWEAAGRDPDPVTDSSAAGRASIDERLAALDVQALTLSTRAVELRAAADVAAMDLAAAQATLKQRELVVQRVQERREVADRLEGLEAQRAEQASIASRIADARRAAPVGPLLDLVRARAAAVEPALRALADVGLSLGQTDPGGAAAVQARAEECRHEGEALATSVELEAGLAEQRQVLAERQQERAAVFTDLTELDTRAAQLPGELIAARASEREARDLAATGATGQRERAEAQTGFAAAEELRALADHIEVTRATRDRALLDRDRGERAAQLAEAQRAADIRGELARELVDGAPCPVCGALEHPAPAPGVGTAVSSQEWEQVREEVVLARQRVTDLDIELARAGEQARSLRAQSAGRTPDEWTRELERAGALERAAEAAGRTSAQQAGRVAELEAQLNRVAETRLELAGRLAGLDVDVTHLVAEVARVETAVVQAAAGYGSVAARKRHADDQATRLGRQAQALAGLEQVQASLIEITEAATRLARESGFPDLESARQVMLPQQTVADLESAAALWQEQRRFAVTRLADADLTAVAEVDPADAAEVAEHAAHALEQAQEGAASARSAADAADAASGRFAQRLAEVRGEAEELARIDAVTEEVLALDAYCRGIAGTPRMTLVTYVLRYWFEHVVAAANVRLAAMSAGKYELLRTDGGARRDSRVGLGLAVLDRHTGRERSPATLSGGETFYTSLSLALGLADVVVAQAGGATLDTLFIDEGFGSLDPDTLEDVMSVIDDLRGNGRVVGIVSHVPDLKERIPERLSVRRTRPDGPSVLRVHA